jgi:hypothetical protein
MLTHVPSSVLERMAGPRDLAGNILAIEELRNRVVFDVGHASRTVIPLDAVHTVFEGQNGWYVGVRKYE